ncbi:MAG: phosphatidate cytidylyltransferase [Puniceicoccales bacterium]|jgi:phosphatidate cytidylyltransferase|nr:phosphatidate cytidylyltransferase [Puniceicoccales bacterium]
MSARIFSLVALWLLVGLALYFGKIHGAIALLILFSTAAHYEFCTLLSRSGGRPATARSVLLGTATLLWIAWSVLTNVTPPPGGWSIVVLPGLLAGILTLALLLISPAKLTKLYTTAPTALSWLYIPCSVAPLILLATERWKHGAFGDPSGVLLVLWIVAIVKFADCGAFLVGTAIGKHKLAPTISPAKTWEGCLGALATAAATGALLAWAFSHFQSELGWTLTKFTPTHAALFAVLLAALGIPSDLVESVFKRKAGVKDSGKTIPGIGGAFDLLDSLLLCSPVAYGVLHFFLLK